MTFFFILSGFVMAWSARYGIKDNYVKSRFYRIYPAYLFMGVISLPFLFDVGNEKIIPSLILYFTATQSWIPDSFFVWNFSGSWSVSTELFFYMVFPLILPILKRKTITAIIIAYTVSSLIIPFAVSIGGGSKMPYFYISPIHRLPEFIIGVCLGILFLKEYEIKSGRVNYFLFIFSILLLIFISPVGNDSFMKRNVITIPAVSFLVYFLAKKKIDKNFITKPFIYIGKISYSFYLMQIPIISFFAKYKSYFSWFENYQVWLFMAFTNLILAMVSYHFVEERFSFKRVR